MISHETFILGILQTSHNISDRYHAKRIHFKPRMVVMEQGMKELLFLTDQSTAWQMVAHAGRRLIFWERNHVPIWSDKVLHFCRFPAQQYFLIASQCLTVNLLYTCRPIIMLLVGFSPAILFLIKLRDRPWSPIKPHIWFLVVIDNIDPKSTFQAVLYELVVVTPPYKYLVSSNWLALLQVKGYEDFVWVIYLKQEVQVDFHFLHVHWVHVIV